MSTNINFLRTRKIIHDITSDDNIWYNSQKRTEELGKFINIIKEEINDEFAETPYSQIFKDTFFEILQLASSFYYTSAFAAYRSLLIYYIYASRRWDYKEFKLAYKHRREEWKWAEGDFLFASLLWEESYKNEFSKFRGEKTYNFDDFKDDRKNLRMYCNEIVHCQINESLYDENSETASKSLHYLKAMLDASLGIMILYNMQQSKGKVKK